MTTIVPHEWRHRSAASRRPDLTQPRRAVPPPVTLERVGPLKRGKLRTIVFDVAGAAQHVEVKDVAGDDEFDGPMADAADPTHQVRPPPGAAPPARPPRAPRRAFRGRTHGSSVSRVACRVSRI